MRAAASSSASGIPSSRRQICATAGQFLSVNSNLGFAALARSMNSWAASHNARDPTDTWSGSGSESEGTR